LPAEYCEFGPDFEKCKPWLIKNAPELYPDLVKEAAEKTTEQLEGLDISCEKDLTQTQGTTSDVKKDEEVKRLPGGKVKKKVTFQVLKDQKYDNFKKYS
jgi:hypothetical protein